MIRRQAARCACAIATVLSSAALATPASLKAARLVPAGADAALLLDSAEALAGPRAFFVETGKLAPIAGADEIARLLRRTVGHDALAPTAEESQRLGLSGKGPRALVVWGHALGATLPVASLSAARAALDRWLAEVGSPQTAKLAPGVPGKLAGRGQHLRAGAIARVAGVDRLLFASGPEAQRLAAGLAQVGRKRRPLSGKPDIAAEVKRAAGPAVLYLHGEPPLRAAVLSLTGTSALLALDGIVLPLASEPLLAGPPASEAACEGAPLVCARAGLGAAGRQLVFTLAQRWALLALPKARADFLLPLAARFAKALEGPVALRSPLPDLASGSADPIFALPFTLSGLARGFSLEPRAALPAGVTKDASGFTIEAARALCLRAGSKVASLGDDCDAPVAPLLPADGETDSVASFDTPALSRAVSRLSPLSALGGSLAAGAYTAKLLAGRLLAASGPLTARARPAPGNPKAAWVELRWPLLH